MKEAIVNCKEVFYKMSSLVFLDFNFNKDNNSEVIQISKFVSL